MDAFDKRLLRVIQKDACLPISAIASQVGLSQTPCWNRLRRLTALGVIKRRVALLDQAKIGLGTTVFVSIEAGDHPPKALARFAADVAAMEEVLDFYRVEGDADYVLRVVVPNASSFNNFFERLTEIIPLKNVTSQFARENIKSETALPIET